MGHAVQVVRVIQDDGGAPYFELDEEALENVLYQDSVKDLPIVVVSVAGKMRQGKSFLLNYLVLYLTYKGVGAWMGEEGSLTGFQWRDGTEACTSGILVWSEVFVLEGPGGKRVAVLLMDTQGTFDTNTTMRECSTVFALSTMLSSVQIYNVMRDIKRDDLDSLQLFVEYGKTAYSKGYNAKPFKNLQFLVRDWEWQQNHTLGATGGADFVDDRLKNVEEIRSCFEQVSCFLLPYPWDLADGQRLGLSDHFKLLLKDFFTNILAWDKLESRIKDFEGETIKTKDILTYFKVFMDIFQDDEMPSPQSAFEANVQIALTKAYEVGMQTFEVTRKAITGDKIDETTPSEEPATFEQSLLQCQSLAVQEFQGRATLGSNKNMTDYYLTKLQQDTETIICALVEVNLAKRRNEEAVKLREELETAERIAETKRDEAERARIGAEEKLDKVKKEKDEAEKKQILAESRGETLGDIHKIFKMQLEMMMKKATQDMAEANEKRKEAEKMKEEAERKRNESEKESAQRGSTSEMISTFGSILRDVISIAAPLVPVIIDTMSGEPRARRGRTRRSRPRARGLDRN